MKVGLRTPDATKILKARTTGRAKRAAKRAINPLYGKKGVGYIKNPIRAVKNRFYHKLTVDPLEPIKNAKMPDIEMPTVEESPFYWHKFMMCIACISTIITSCKVIFSNTLDLRWCLATGILWVIFILLRVFKV